MSETTVGTALSTEERGDLAEKMLPVAGRLASIVRGDGGLQDVQHLLAGLGAQEQVALLVVLAGLVDPDTPVADALRWLEFNENGETIVPELPGWNQGVSLRDLGEELPVDTDPADLDEVAVARALKGDRSVRLSRAERLKAILTGRKQGKSYIEMDALLGYRPGSANKAVLRACRAAEARGETLEVAPPDSRVLTQQEVVAIRKEARAGATDVELALRHGVSRPAVSRLVSGATYAQYGGPLRGAPTSEEGSGGRRVTARQEAAG
ncbi:hypothetical protein ACODT3_42885 [Streptomyces sp. 4.24]|uniref:hypothetical protein n=1 Tax=Streptomyces tritrimontium TaxID=3406573 RepID=UPI003BB6826A